MEHAVCRSEDRTKLRFFQKGTRRYRTLEAPRTPAGTNGGHGSVRLRLSCAREAGFVASNGAEFDSHAQKFCDTGGVRLTCYPTRVRRTCSKQLLRIIRLTRAHLNPIDRSVQECLGSDAFFSVATCARAWREVAILCRHGLPTVAMLSCDIFVVGGRCDTWANRDMVRRVAVVGITPNSANARHTRDQKNLRAFRAFSPGRLACAPSIVDCKRRSIPCGAACRPACLPVADQRLAIRRRSRQ